MILISNIGHFKNTFDANIGIIEACNTDESLKKRFLDNFSDEDRMLANKIIDNNNYMQFNLLNALLLHTKRTRTRMSTGPELIRLFDQLCIADD